MHTCSNLGTFLSDQDVSLQLGCSCPRRPSTFCESHAHVGLSLTIGYMIPSSLEAPPLPDHNLVLAVVVGKCLYSQSFQQMVIGKSSHSASQLLSSTDQYPRQADHFPQQADYNHRRCYHHHSYTKDPSTMSFSIH
jgi:hypothetical protein